jgi:hypothetical protein
MKKLLKASISFFSLNLKGKKDVILILTAYMQISCLIRCYPLRKYYSRYFLHDNSKTFDFAPYRKDLKLIRKVIKHMPGKHTCLKESLVVFLFFKRKGFHIPLYLGVSKKDEFQAHAWYDQNGSNGFDALDVS